MFCGAVRTIHLLIIGRKIYRKKDIHGGGKQIESQELKNCDLHKR
jgi:hypothetical protein